jgi:hypothetical protein
MERSSESQKQYAEKRICAARRAMAESVRRGDPWLLSPSRLRRLFFIGTGEYCRPNERPAGLGLTLRRPVLTIGTKRSPDGSNPLYAISLNSLAPLRVLNLRRPKDESLIILSRE